MESLTRAYELRDRASAREKILFESHYYHLVTGELEKANQVYEVFARTYPWSEGRLVIWQSVTEPWDSMIRPPPQRSRPYVETRRTILLIRTL